MYGGRVYRRKTKEVTTLKSYQSSGGLLFALFIKEVTAARGFLKGILENYRAIIVQTARACASQLHTAALTIISSLSHASNIIQTGAQAAAGQVL